MRPRTRPAARRPIKALCATAGRIRHAHGRVASTAEYVPFLMHRRPEALAPVAGVSSGEAFDDRVLVERIVAAYRAAAEDFRHDRSSMWAGFFEQHHEGIHDALIAGDVATVAAVLRDPAASNLLYG